MRVIQDFEYDRVRKTFSDISKNLVEFQFNIKAQFSGVVYRWIERGYHGYLDPGKVTTKDKSYDLDSGGHLTVASQAYDSLAATLKVPTEYKTLTVNSLAAPAIAQGRSFEFVELKEVLGGTIMVDNAIIIETIELTKIYGQKPLNLFTKYILLPDHEPKIQVDGIIYDVESTNYNNW